MTAGERQSEKRRGIPAPRAVLQVRLSQVLERRPSAPEFATQCIEAGVLIVPNVNAEGRIVGLSYRLLDGDDEYGFGMKRQFSGTDLGKRFVWSSVAAAIAYEEEKHRALVDQWTLEADRRLRRFRCFLRPAPDLNFDASIAAAKRRKKKLAADPAIIQRNGEIILVEPRPRSIRRALEEALRRGWLRLAAMSFRHLFEPVAAKLGMTIIADPDVPAPCVVSSAKPRETLPETHPATASPPDLIESDEEREESRETLRRARRLR